MMIMRGRDTALLTLTLNIVYMTVQNNVKSGVKKAEKISDVFLKQNCNMLPFHV